MSLATTTAALFRQVPFTHPVRSEAGSCRGFLEMPGLSIDQQAGIAMERTEYSLRVTTADAQRLRLDDEVPVQIGTLGEPELPTDPHFVVRRVRPIDELESLVLLVPDR